MCIRDRVRAGDSVAPRRRARVGQHAHRARRQAPLHLRRRGCLLYTSDAADERSSVDIGGRRIIKKKKEQN